MHHVTITSVTGYVRDMLRDDRERAHSHVMSAFPVLKEQDSPRAAMGILWHLDERSRCLTVQSGVEPSAPGLLGEVVERRVFETPRAGDRLTVSLFRNCQKTPASRTPEELRPILKQGKAYRSKLVTVPENERLRWAMRCLAASGLGVDEKAVSVGPVRDARLGPHLAKVPAVEITASVIVKDADLFDRAVRGGTGKCKSYGLGMWRVERA